MKKGLLTGSNGQRKKVTAPTVKTPAANVESTASNAIDGGPGTVQVVLLGDQLTADQATMALPGPEAGRTGISVTSVKHLLSQHAHNFNEGDWADEPMQFAVRFLKRPWRMLYNRQESELGHFSRYTESTFGTRHKAAVHNGFCIPTVRGQAVVYDPRGQDINIDEFMRADDAVYNVILEQYGEPEPTTEAVMDDMADRCAMYMGTRLRVT